MCVDDEIFKLQNQANSHKSLEQSPEKFEKVEEATENLRKSSTGLQGQPE
jgi:hypothetical protein